MRVRSNTVTLVLILLLVCFKNSYAQEAASIDSFKIYGDVKITIDKPISFSNKKKTIITFYALPNGNSTEQTMGKKNGSRR